MCGIAGIAGYADRDAAERAVTQMTATLARRGPDGEGLESWPGAVLGHRRLSIFDLSDAGRQPMLSPNRRTGVTFNGAIYNFHKLRAQLEAAGYTFASNTDTEVLVHGYRAWGMDRLVQKLHGMFAFALWDEDAQRLFLVRDRLGVKPLLYAIRNETLTFASTARALKAAGCGEELDERAVLEFLEFGFITDDRAIYRGVAKVPAGHILEWHAGTVNLREYWRPPSASESGGPTFEEAVAETERLLLRAVELRLQADVPVGALLSGGIDSSLVCWAIARLGGEITAFTVGTPGDEWDESADATATAKELGIAHRIIQSDARSTPEVSELVGAYGEPFACASALGMLHVSHAVKQEATVLLTGDGGDDVFLGYPRQRAFALAERVARRLPERSADVWMWLRGAIPKTGPLGRASHFADYATGGLGAVTAAHDGLPAYRALHLLGERFQNATVAQREIPWSFKSARHLVEDYLAYDRNTRFVGEYLTKVDGSTMRYGLEARSPFLDQDVWDFAAALPLSVRLRGGTLKAVLREIARRRIGERVASGRKRGFGIPVQRWIAGRWRGALENAFTDSLAGRAGWIDERATRSVLAAVPQNQAAPIQLFYLFVLESWLRAEAASSIPSATAEVLTRR